VDEVVAGIGGYGNSIGIPTVGGETNFDPTYARNPLVNAMCVGVMNKDQIQRGRAAGVGNAIIYVGAKTGRDGINGASFASSEFADDKQADRAAVQVGDPFMEKLLTDACLEVTRQHRDALVGMQDMGAAGLISSSVEMADKAGAGMALDLDLIPQREPGMIPFEIMLSESQERMLLCVRAGSEQEIIDVFTKYGLDAVVCGHVIDELRYKLYHKGDLVCDVPVSLLASDAPIYHQQGEKPARLEHPVAPAMPEITDVQSTWLAMLGQSTIADKSSLYRRYDAQVKTNTVVLPGSDAGVVRIRGTHKALAMTTDSNGRYLYLNPQRGGAMVVAEAARNLVASGAEPIGITDCLNYGDPTQPTHFYELAESAKGITSACKQLNTPVISGNVSLYNETNGAAIHPTPMIGMVGLIDDLATVTTSGFKNAGDVIFLVGETGDDFNGTELQKMLQGQIAGELFPLDLRAEKANQDAVLGAIRSGLVSAAHDLSIGGFAVALTEMALQGNLGADVTLNLTNAQLFAETQGRFLLTVPADKAAEFSAQVGALAQEIGRVTSGDQLHVQTASDAFAIDLTAARATYEEAIPCHMK
jgi:phosphoribosylformylglycinamidine synthase